LQTNRKKASTVDDKISRKKNTTAVSDAPLPAPRRSLRRYALWTAGVALLLAAAGSVALAAWVARIAPGTPDVAALLQVRKARPSILLSADGTRLAKFSDGLQQRVRLEQVSTYVIQALIATEDHRFYEHNGIDIERTLAAVLHTAGGDTQGGSTITQQLVRNLFPEEIGHARTVERKLAEMITALRIEKVYSKDQILETYLNTVPFLYNVTGIEMAARTYFDKPASELGILESATLVGMLKGTSYYNPILNPERARERRNVVLAQMVKYGMLAEADYRRLRQQPLRVTLHRQPDPLGSAPHFAAYVRRQMLDWAQRHGYNLYTDGLVIESTLDDHLQQAAEKAVATQSRVLQEIADVEWGRSSVRLASTTPDIYASLHKKVKPFSYFWEAHDDLLDDFIRDTPRYRKAVAGGASESAALARLKADETFMDQLRSSKTRLEAGFVAIDPDTGAIKAWVGSRDFERDQFDHVAQAERQPGSTFKPIVYGAALEQGLRPDRLYTDGPVEIPLADGSTWRPTDMSGATGEPMSMREGLIFSKNTITAQVMQDAGVASVVKLAHAVGVNQSRLDPVPSLALGTSPVTLLEMVSAYSTIADLGKYRKPICISRIRDRNGKVLAEFDGGDGGEAKRAMSRDTAIELIDMLRGVVRRGTGVTVKNRFGIVADIAGKTGTTQNNTDGWFILMHPDLVAGAWVGFNDPRVAMRSDYWGQGGHNAVLLVGDFYRDVLKAKLIDVKAKFPRPKPLPPLMVQVPDDWASQVNEHMNTVPRGYSIVGRSDGDTTVVIGPEGVRTTVTRVDRDPVSAQADDELGRFLSDLERGKQTGRVSSGNSGTVGEGRSGAVAGGAR